jgi:hypothetical protein
MAKEPYTAARIGEVVARLRTIAARLEAVRVAMQVLHVEAIDVDKSAYATRSMAHLEDFSDHAARDLRKRKPAVDLGAFLPKSAV